jgi:hypothetical protein
MGTQSSKKSKAPEGRKKFNMMILGVEFLSPLRGLPIFTDLVPTAHAVGYILPPLRGLLRSYV